MNGIDPNDLNDTLDNIKDRLDSLEELTDRLHSTINDLVAQLDDAQCDLQQLANRFDRHYHYVIGSIHSKTDASTF